MRKKDKGGAFLALFSLCETSALCGACGGEPGPAKSSTNFQTIPGSYEICLVESFHNRARAAGAAKAEDGYRLWLRYDSLPKEMIEVYLPRVISIVAPGASATLGIREQRNSKRT